MTAADKAKLLGLLFWVFTGLTVAMIVIFGLVYIAFFGFIIAQAPHRPSDPPPAFLLPFVVLVVAIILIMTLLFSIPKIVAGYGLRKQKPWARGWSIAASIMACMSFPLGTALGVFGLVFLFSDEGKEYFETQTAMGRQLAGAGGLTPPPPDSWK